MKNKKSFIELIVHDISNCIICKTKTIKFFWSLALKCCGISYIIETYRVSMLIYAIAILFWQNQASFDTETNLKTIHTSFVKEMNQFEQSNAMWDLCINSVICATCANRTMNMESWNGLHSFLVYRYLQIGHNNGYSSFLKHL